ncbi:MAG: hypothetical protein A2428_01940 [Bdellovibrionales bacterium RIFOXYC1_FULL_54_43]|nr:MAG: hypothetical protein A2428_01940 [Bdellovibrionales bacterium RIFOXYC1_FULL_54_43]OFZ81700.1 MAG: hypothetical protein A2603_12150 [Bdellovibrionales bacterium RIFOXYD1_FULL_55_31]
MLNRAVLLAATLVFVLCFLRKIAFIVLFFLFALIFGMAMNPFVAWMEKRGIPRIVGSLIAATGVMIVVGGLGWLIVPIIADQASQLWSSLPEYLSQVSAKFAAWLDAYPQLQKRLSLDSEAASRVLSGASGVLGGLLNVSLSIVTAIALLIVFATLVMYVLIRPRPLIHGLLQAIPKRHRDPMARALAKSSTMVQAWVTSNVIVGGVEAVASWVFLTWMNVPGATVWAALTFFSEMVPKLGPYIMAVPPTLVAFAVDPRTALWTALFYMALNEITGDTLAPWIRGKQMELHPAFLILVMLAMASAFGLLGALISTPLAGFIKAFYEEFWLRDQVSDPENRLRVEAVIHRNTDWKPRSPGKAEGQDQLEKAG